MNYDRAQPQSTASTKMTHHRKNSSTGLLSSMTYRMDDEIEEDSERRTPNRKSSRMFKHRNNASQGSKRHLRASQKRRKAGITVDTTQSRHKGMTPKEIRYGANMDKHTGLRIFTSPRTADESPVLAKDKWWANSRVKRQLSRKNNLRPSNDHSTLPGFAHGELSGGHNADGLDVVRTDPPNEGLSPSKLHMLDISPSDRRIFVGLSIPSESLSEVESDMEARTRKRSDSDSSPFTPTIIITPAQQRSQFVQHKPRPASSVYSRATQFGRTPFMQRDSQPPMPRLPENAKYNSVAVNSVAAATVTTKNTTNNGVGEREDKWPKQARDSNMTAFEEDDETPRGNRIMSSGTYFEEDESPNIIRRELEISKDPLSIDTTLPTPRRSRGWWNVITTPFELNRSNSHLWTRYPPADDTAPEVPKLSQSQSTNVPLGLITANSGPPLVSCFSASTVTTMTSPWSVLEAERSPISPFGQSLAPVYKAHAGPELSIAEQLSKPSPQQSAIASVVNPFETPETDRHLSPSTQSSPPQTDRSTVWPSAYDNHQSRSNTSASFSPDTGSVPVVGTAQMGTMMTPGVVRQTKDQVSQLSVSRHAEVTQNHYTMFPAAHLPRRTPSPSEQSTKSSSHRNSFSSKSRGPPGYAPGTYFPGPPISEKHQEGQEQKRKTHFTCFGKTKDSKKRKKRMCLVCGICWGILLAVVLIVVLVVLLNKRHKPDNTPVQSQWLNITNFPPIPTGVSTIAQPELAYEESGCVEPATQWSCALPKEEHASVAPNKPEQPNFRLVIRYKNDTASKTRRDGAPTQSLALRSEDLFSPFPEPPNADEQDFLGNTTDQITEPFAGEDTPFFISFISPSSAPPTTRVKRQNNDDNNNNNDDESSFSNITDLIPPPATISGGLAAPANLLPLPTAQPLRLFNRGQPDEHYGFYTYFDKSIFLKDIAGTNSSFGGNSADTDGGALFDSATLRCTFSQTRFLVQIWTNSAQSRPLLGAPAAQAQTQTQSADAAAATEVSASSATTFVRPGSFPYPVSITLDRHGGALEKKMVYCYGIDKHGKIEPNRKTFTLEDRSFSGDAVNPAQGPFTNVPVGRDEGGPGGIDGGSGGCGCRWTNWAEQ